MAPWSFECAQMVGEQKERSWAGPGSDANRTTQKAGLRAGWAVSTGAQHIPRRLEPQGSQWMGVGHMAALRTITRQPEMG